MTAKTKFPFSDLTPLAKMAPFSSMELRVGVAALLALAFATHYAQLAEHIGYGAAIAVIVGAVIVGNVIHPVLTNLVGWVVYRQLSAAYGQASAIEVASIYLAGGSVRDMQQIENIARTNSQTSR